MWDVIYEEPPKAIAEKVKGNVEVATTACTACHARSLVYVHSVGAIVGLRLPLALALQSDVLADLPTILSMPLSDPRSVSSPSVVASPRFMLLGHLCIDRTPSGNCARMP